VVACQRRAENGRNASFDCRIENREKRNQKATEAVEHGLKTGTWTTEAVGTMKKNREENNCESGVSGMERQERKKVGVRYIKECRRNRKEGEAV